MKKRYLFIIFIIGLAFASTTGYCQNKVWPYPIPCRINASISPNVLFLSLGDVSTSIAQGMFYPVDDKVVLNDGSVIADYYRDSLGVEYYQPIDKTHHQTPPAGWSSWNAYYYVFNADTIRKVTDFFNGTLKPFGLHTIQIDGGWETPWDIWRPFPDAFPDGMKDIADYIKKDGFEPGIWIVPQGTDNADDTLRGDIFMRNKDSSFLHTHIGVYTVDPTAPQGQQYITQLMDTIVNWGFTYFKIDAQMIADSSYDIFANSMRLPDMPHAYYYRKTLEAIRNGIGPQSYLTSTWGPGLLDTNELKIAPYTGIGYINAGRPYWDIARPNQTFLTDVFNGMSWYSYLNNIVCYVDLDAFFVRDTADFEQSRAWATMITMAGVPMINCDPISQLSEDRLELMKRMYPPVDIRPLDLYPYTEQRKHIWDLKINQNQRNYDVVAVIKSDYYNNQDLIIHWDNMGWGINDGYHVYDFWNKQYLGIWTSNMAVDVPDKGCRLFSFVKADNYPELISTSRHITQGWVDLDTLTYDTAAMTMSGVSSVVGGDPYELRFAVPNNTQDSYIAESAEVDSLPFSLKQDSNFITLDFTSPQSAHIPWKVHFTKGPLSVNASAPIPQGVELYQNYPNPFGPGSPARTDFSTFSFFLPHSQKADLSIYDLLGRRVADIYNGFIAAGTFHIGFDGSHLPPGAFFSVLRTDDNYQVKPLVIER